MLPIINTAVFLSVAFVHALRLGMQAPMAVGGVEITLWLSVVAVIAALLLAWYNWHLLSKPGRPEVLRLLLVLFIIDIGGILYSWIAGLSYWGLSGDDFAWFVLFDLLVIAIITNFMKKK